jgi:hypothetical protein
MAFKRVLRAPTGGASTLQLADGSVIVPDGSGFVRVASHLVDDLLGAGFTLPEAAPRLVMVTTRCSLPYNGQSSGSQTFLTYRTRYVTLKTSRVSGLRLVYANIEMLTTGEVNGPANYTIKASVEVNGTIYPVFFGEQREKLVEAGGFVISDPVGVSIAPGSEIFVRSRPLIGTLGEKWAVQGSLETAFGESYVTTDAVDSGATGANAANSFGPCAILGMVPNPAPSVVIMGSSSAVGQGDTASTNERDLGYLARLLSTNTGYCRMVRASQTAAHFLADSRRRLSLLAALNPTHVIYQFGTNDLTNGGDFATVQDRLFQSFSILAGMGLRVIGTTFTPVGHQHRQLCHAR